MLSPSKNQQKQFLRGNLQFTAPRSPPPSSCSNILSVCHLASAAVGAEKLIKATEHTRFPYVYSRPTAQPTVLYCQHSQRAEQAEYVLRALAAAVFAEEDAKCQQDLVPAFHLLNEIIALVLS